MTGANARANNSIHSRVSRDLSLPLGMPVTAKFARVGVHSFPLLLFVKLVLHINSAGSRFSRKDVAVCFVSFKCVSIPSHKSNNTSSRKENHINSITTLHDRAKKQDRYSLKINIP
jgi:hypothetical protein